MKFKGKYHVEIWYLAGNNFTYDTILKFQYFQGVYAKKLFQGGPQQKNLQAVIITWDMKIMCALWLPNKEKFLQRIILSDV